MNIIVEEEKELPKIAHTVKAILDSCEGSIPQHSYVKVVEVGPRDGL